MTISTVRRWVRRVEVAAGVCALYRNPLPRFMDYLGLVQPGREMPAQLRNGLVFTVRTGSADFAIIDEIFLNGIYDKALTRLHPGDTVLDIGAQSGIFAMAAAARGATVLCVEPLEDNVRVLSKNAQLNRLQDRVSVLNFAVAGLPGQRDLYVMATDTGGATIFPAIHPAWAQEVRVSRTTVQCVTLNDIFARHNVRAYDCVKMDCEGAEFEILEQVPREDLSRIRMLIMEYHPLNGDIRQLRHRLESFGFAVDVNDNPCILFATRTTDVIGDLSR